MKSESLTLVVPCYNEEDTLELFMAEILKTQESLPHVFFDLLFINDGSRDNTLSKIKSLADRHPSRVSYVSFSRNFGKEAGILAGLQHAKGDYVALIDADLQDPPELLLEMYRLIRTEGYDMVGTKRINREGEPLIRSFFANSFYKLHNKISDVHLEEGVRDYRLMTRDVVEAVIDLPEQNRFSKGIFSWVGFKVTYLEYNNIERSAGESSWSFYQLFSYAIEGIVSFSDAPLNIASMLGLIMFVIALFYGAYIIIKTLLLGSATPGWPSLAVIVLGMGGLQLFCLGIVGKYISKIFKETKNRPMYIIKEKQIKQETDESN